MKLYFHDLLLQYALQPVAQQPRGGSPTTTSRSGVPISNDFAPHRVPITIRPSRTAPVINPVVSSAEVYELNNNNNHPHHSSMTTTGSPSSPLPANNSSVVARQRKLWYKTREGNILSFDCDEEALRPFGYQHGDRLLASWGPTSGTWSTVVGVRRGVLWVREDGSLEDGVCALVGFRNKADFETRMGWVWHGSTTVPETQHVILPTLSHANTAARFLEAGGSSLPPSATCTTTTTDRSTVLFMRSLRCDPQTMVRSFGFYHGEVLYQDREGMSHEGLRLPTTETNPTLRGGNNIDLSATTTAINDSGSRPYFGGGLGSHERTERGGGGDGFSGGYSHNNNNNSTNASAAAKSSLSVNTSIIVVPAGVDEATGDLYAFFVDVNRYMSNLWDHQRSTGMEPSMLVSAEDVLHSLQQATSSTTNTSSITPLPILASTAFAQRLPGCHTSEDVRRLLGLISARRGGGTSAATSTSFNNNTTLQDQSGYGGGEEEMSFLLGEAKTRNQFDVSWGAAAKVISLDSHSLLNAMVPTTNKISSTGRGSVAPLQVPQTDHCIYLVPNTTSNISSQQNSNTTVRQDHYSSMGGEGGNALLSSPPRHQDIYSLL